MRSIWVIHAALVMLALFPGPAAVQARGGTATPPRLPHDWVEESKPLGALDLVRLRDIGPMTSGPEPHAVTLSPDRKRIAFLVQQADPVANDYQLAVYVMAVRVGAVPVLVDTGGELIRKTVTGIGGGVLNTGFPVTISPVWAKDGSAIYFLKRTNHSTQIWRARTDGSGSEPVTHDTGDVVEFAQAVGGNSITYATNRVDAERQTSLSAEALRGYRYDARFMPLFASGPDAFPSMLKAVANLDLTTGLSTPGTESDRGFLGKATEAASARNSDTTSDGRSARVVENSDPVLDKPTQLYAEATNGRSYRCAAETCSGAAPLWWTRDGKRVRFLRREGWGDSETAIYE